MAQLCNASSVASAPSGQPSHPIASPAVPVLPSPMPSTLPQPAPAAPTSPVPLIPAPVQQSFTYRCTVVVTATVKVTRAYDPDLLRRAYAAWPQIEPYFQTGKSIGFKAVSERSGQPETWARQLAFSEAYDGAMKKLGVAKESVRTAFYPYLELDPSIKLFDKCINVKTGNVIMGSEEPPHVDEFQLSIAASQMQPAAPWPMSSAQQAASATQAYSEGRRDRVAWEAWFDSLPAGSAKDGALFWVGERNRANPGSCEAVDQPRAWSEGCHAAQAKLALVDIRRRTEANYWWGWNSL